MPSGCNFNINYPDFQIIALELNLAWFLTDKKQKPLSLKFSGIKKYNYEDNYYKYGTSAYL
jgi:hypothetical protein